jgi:hypothetical protein
MFFKLQTVATSGWHFSFSIMPEESMNFNSLKSSPSTTAASSVHDYMMF